MVETSFFELRCKDVINIVDGTSLGHISDIVLEICSGKILGFVVPCGGNLLNIFRAPEEIFIPYQNICKIGSDVILVELMTTEIRNFKSGKFSDVSTLSSPNVKLMKTQQEEPEKCATPNEYTKATNSQK